MDQEKPTDFRFRCPSAFRAAIEAAATDEMISSSAYVRRAVARTLQADGVLIKPEQAREPRAASENPRGSGRQKR